MAIVNIQAGSGTPPTPQEVLATRVAQQIGIMSNMFNQNINTFNTVSNFVWNNRNFTPQEVFDAYGSNGADLFKLSAAFNSMIEIYTGTSYDPIPPNWSYVIADDGSVTVTYNDPSPSSSTSSSSSSSS